MFIFYAFAKEMVCSIIDKLDQYLGPNGFRSNLKHRQRKVLTIGGAPMMVRA